MPHITAVPVEVNGKMAGSLPFNVTNITGYTDPAHIGGSHALCVFINVVSLLWVALFSWLTDWAINFCLSKSREEICPRIRIADRSWYRIEKKREKTRKCIWSSVNFAILWSNLASLIYCYSGAGNCILYYETNTQMQDAKVMLILCAAITYLIQLCETRFHLQKQRKSSDVLLTALHDELKSKPVGITWKATCFHLKSHGDGVEREVTHTEVCIPCFAYKTINNKLASR